MPEPAAHHDDAPPWWRQDARWSVPAVVAGIGTALGVLALDVIPGLGGILGAEAGFGIAAGFGVATASQLRRAYRRRADDDAETYTDGVGYELAATGSVSPGPIAVISGAPPTDPDVTLYRRALTATDGPAVDTIVARAGRRRLRLQHRSGTPDDLDGDGLAPDLLVRWVDDSGTAVAGARRLGCRWTVTAAHLTMHLEVPDDRRRRPSRRTFLDSRGRAFLLTYETRRRLPVVRLAAPVELDTAEVVLCLWLCQLLDAHAAARERWQAAGDEWALVEDDFPSSVGPGGFGRTFSLPVPSIGGGGGGS